MRMATSTCTAHHVTRTRFPLMTLRSVKWILAMFMLLFLVPKAPWCSLVRTEVDSCCVYAFMGAWMLACAFVAAYARFRKFHESACCASIKHLSGTVNRHA